MRISDPLPNDPFFRRGADTEWNACIGSQGDEQNYVDGYMQAAMELVSAVLDKKMYGSRDTLAMPILFNARHAVELVLKFSASRIDKAGLQARNLQHSHKILPLWEFLHGAKIGDRTLSHSIEALKPFVDSLAAIDDDGQELRYHRNIDDNQSLEKYSIASLEVIRDSLAELSQIAEDLQVRTIEYVRERATNTFTKRCSRFDLFQIARVLPPRAEWNGPAFDAAKAKIRAEFALSSNDFSDAINVIKKHREMLARLGVETPLAHLTDDLVIASLKEWRKWHPARDKAKPEGSSARDIVIEKLIEHRAIGAEVVATIEKLLTPDQFGELQAVFYLGRDRWFSECFETRAEEAKRCYLGPDGPSVGIMHLFNKMNFLADVTRGAAQLGRLTLARVLATL